MRQSRWLYAALILLYVILLGPYLVIFISAFGAESTLAFPPEGFSLKWFANVFNTSQFITSFWLSLRIGVAGDRDRAAAGHSRRLRPGSVSFSWPRAAGDDLLVADPGAWACHRFCHAALLRAAWAI